MPENQTAILMRYIGLLTSQQKQEGYFVSQDEDFVWLWRSRPYLECISVFLYDQCTIKQVRDKAQEDMDGQKKAEKQKRPKQKAAKKT